MKQILQDLSSGKILLEEVPCPSIKPEHILAQSTTSLISAGTERMLLDFGKAGWLSRIKQQPERVEQVLAKIRTDGIKATYDSIVAKLEQPIPLGYCNVAKVLEVAPDISCFFKGDRIVSNSSHSEVVCVPKLLCAKIPDAVSDEEASFTVLGSIALHGIRLIKPELGESVAVFGLGLIGLLAVQILKAHGARVIGIDVNVDRVNTARTFGVDAVAVSEGLDPVQSIFRFSGQQGVDAVLITASSKDDKIIQQAAQACRKRGRIVLTGTTGLKLRRSDFYKKELTFQVSCAYGPGRHDALYEQKGIDYPSGYVRWTIHSNFETILGLIKDGSLKVRELITAEYSFDNAIEAYKELNNSSSLGILLKYNSKYNSEQEEELRKPVVELPNPRHALSDLAVSLIGAGEYAKRHILPALKGSGVSLKWIASSKGDSASTLGKQYGFHKATTDTQAILRDLNTHAVIIATRHDSHARYVCEALEAGKNILVEKPLCINPSELDTIITAYKASQDASSNPPILLVGFNRRFSPLTTLLRSKIQHRKDPLCLSFRCNSGYLPKEHWTQDPQIGGGRIVGEVCHFVDLLQFLVDHPIRTVSAMSQGTDLDSVIISLSFEDGSIGTIQYFTNGTNKYSKEFLEVFSDSQVFTIDNFRDLRAFGCGGFHGKGLWSQDKGQQACYIAFIEALERGLPSPIGFESIVNSTKATFAVLQSLEERSLVQV